MQKSYETEGVLGFRKLQIGGYKTWSREEIDDSDLKPITKKILYIVAKENSVRSIPNNRYIETKVGLPKRDVYEKLYSLKEREIVLSFTIFELVKLYGLSYLGYSGGYFKPPEHLKWLSPYLDGVKGRTSLPWHKILDNPRRIRYPLHWITLAENEDGFPYYLPLDLHVSKEKWGKIQLFKI